MCIVGMVTGGWPKPGPAFTTDDLHACTRAGIVDAIDAGVTTVFDWCHVISTPAHAEAAMDVHLSLPLRVVFACGASMTQKPEEVAGIHTAGSWEHAAQLRERHCSCADQRLTFALALQGLDCAILEITRADIAAARAMGVPMSFHVGVPMGLGAKRSIARLAEEGLLGTETHFVH